MRPALLIASATAVSALSYIGYKLYDRDEALGETVAAQASATAPSDEASDDAPSRAAVTAVDRRPAPPERPQSAREERVVSTQKRQAAVSPLPRKKRVTTADSSLPDASALKAADATAIAAHGAGARHATGAATGAQANPKDQRWISELSGTGARLKMARGRQDTACRPGQPCVRPEASRDIQVVGIRVKAERLVETPSDALDGRVKQGHYAEGTPAVYVD